jgi:superfamily II DNA or RNA helicase/diadenosine tetraphosphate (Ap4A) HIT family hydrolase
VLAAHRPLLENAPMTATPFLRLPVSSWIASNALAFAIRDQFPVSPGHTLVITRRLVATWFEATPEEQRALFALVDEVKRALDTSDRPPDGYNVGFNAGTAAGQTVAHLHVHMIPRYHGDMDDPRGGVRHVIPSAGNYLAAIQALTTGEDAPLARHLLPHVARAREVAVVAAFVHQSGLHRVQPALEQALDADARVRLITGDYCGFTQVAALQQLLDWQASRSAADAPGRLETRVVEVDLLPGARTFHPKSWFLEGPQFGVAWVGSSNLSETALGAGIEWNLRVDRDRDRSAWEAIRTAFERLWTRARALDSAWIADYAARTRRRNLPLPAGEVDAEPLPPVHAPHAVQAEALAALQQARRDGRGRALVVLATGLGKTWLAAFDYGQLWDEVGRPPRLLFVAHRREILRQAAGTFRALAHARGHDARVSWFLEEEADLSGDLVFASVAKLARPRWLARLAHESFDAVVVDEVHHATARSYREILAVLRPRFLLGLTATPDRADNADVYGMFDDFVAFRAGIDRGIAVGRLVPFRYFGVKDDIDYRPIPWRNGRFDPAELAAAAQTERRMQTLWEAWERHPGERTLVFCCSVEHARYTTRWLRAKNVRVARVDSEPDADDRDTALLQLAGGELDAICAVDVFNEGVDVPALDRVVMLRPTESGLLFLQQLGRGLRASEGKRHLTIVDFVGNHRIFLERLRTLVSLAAKDPAKPMRAVLDAGHVDLPGGCAIDLELEAKAILEGLFRVGGSDEVERAYRQLRDARGERPTAGELYRMGYLPSSLRRRHGSWFAWVRSERDLAEASERAVEAAGAFLEELETTPMTKSFKMVTLQVLLDARALGTGLEVASLASRAWERLAREPDLLADVPPDERPADPTARSWQAYWRRNPIAAWTAGTGRRWFRIEGERFAPAFPVDDALTELVAELVDYRLAQYRRRAETSAGFEGFTCKVTWNQRDPVLKLPDRTAAALPTGDVPVRLADGAVWSFRFAREYCNVARPAGTDRNQLPDLLRRWFGPGAGQPGTAFEVRFAASPDGLWAEPQQSNLVELAPLFGVVAFPDLRAAAGAPAAEFDAPEAERVLLPIADPGRDVFAVRVSGTSMDGGKAPLRDGDWALFRFARGVPADALANQVALLQLPGETGGNRFVIKRIARDGTGWRLTSDNPDGPTLTADESTLAIARLVRGVRPEDLAPPLGTRIPDADLATRFGLEGLRPVSGRYSGHVFVFVEQPGQLLDPTRVASPVPLRPGETAYVLARAEGGWRYLGVGRRGHDEIGLQIRRSTSPPGGRSATAARPRARSPRACWSARSAWWTCWCRIRCSAPPGSWAGRPAVACGSMAAKAASPSARCPSPTSPG